MIESEMRRALLAAAPHALPNVRLFARNVGFFKLQTGHGFKAGIKGQADIWGFLRGGKSIELELKTKRGKLSPDQERWRDFCLEWGVIYLLLEARDDANPIARWVEEIRHAIG